MLNKIIICASWENITDESFDEFKKNAAAEGIVAVREAGFVSGMGQIIEAGLDLCLRIYKIYLFGISDLCMQESVLLL